MSRMSQPMRPAMSLRFRLNLVITLVFVLILVVSITLAIDNARRAVAEEVRSTAHLTLQLLGLAFSTVGARGGDDRLTELVERLGELERTRHMEVEISGMAGVRALSRRDGAHHVATAPAWFVALVRPPPLEIRESIAAAGMPAGEIVIRADPDDEITEAWDDVRALLVVVVVFALVANGVVYLVLGHGLRPVEAIVRGLDAIEQGDYQARLGRPALPELGRIVDKVNHIAAVLARSRAQTRALAQRSLAIQEEERRYLAHELHDEMGQSISAIKAVAVSISQRIGAREPDIAQSARTISDISSTIYDTVRGMMHRLRPAILDELGLVAAMEQLVDDWNARNTELFCALRVEGDFDGTDEATGISLYRIVQEALTNVVKHARASRVEVDLQRHGSGELTLRIADDGVGFDPESSARGLGLLGMHERVAALDGSFTLRSRPGTGLIIDIDIPAPAERGRKLA